MINWASAYASLSRIGYTDQQISGLAGVHRSVVNKVRNGQYAFQHEPGYAGGKKVLEALAAAVAEGILDTCPIHEAAAKGGTHGAANTGHD